MDDKERIRKKIESIRSKLSREDVAVKSSQIHQYLFRLPEFQRAKNVSLYVTKGNEVQTKSMIKDTLKLGKRVLVPVVDKESEKLMLSDLRDFDLELEPGTFGILEPKPAYRRIVPPAEVDLVVVPGLAFDVKGHRLGHGKGYYDKLLGEVSWNRRNAKFVALAYAFQVLDEIPHERHDISVQKIVTEKGIIDCSVR